MIVGYARVSTQDQKLDIQRSALKGARCQKIFEEKVSGAKVHRPELIRMMEQLREGDVVVVRHVDRLARSTHELLELAERFRTIGAGLRSLSQPWADTTSPAGRMMFTILAGVAEFERELILERTSAGKAAALARGVRFGRPPLIAADRATKVMELFGEGKPVREVAELAGVSKQTIYRLVRRMEGS